MNDTNGAAAPVRRVHIDELVDKEARHIVEMMIEDHLNKLDLPLPKSLDVHVDHVLKHRPDIIEKAREHVDAGQDYYSESMRELGIAVEVVKPLAVHVEVEINP